MLCKEKKGRKEGRKERREEGRKGGRRDGGKEGRKEGKEGRKEGKIGKWWGEHHTVLKKKERKTRTGVSIRSLHLEQKDSLSSSFLLLHTKEHTA